MAEKVNIDSSLGWYIGEDQIFQFEILTPKSPTSGQRITVEVTSWALERTFRVNQGDADPAPLSNSIGIGITIIGVYNADHQWHYFPAMTRDEAILIKCYDSEKDGRARFSLHSAFEDPTSPANAKPRQSIEVRAFAFFD